MTPRDDYCGCDNELLTSYERRIGKCYECERLEDRMNCVACGELVGWCYTDGRPTFCSDACESRWETAA